MLLTDIREAKAILEVPAGDTSEDRKILFLIEWASAWILELLNRPGIEKKERTEYYAGSGTDRLLLRSRPVFTTPTIQLFFDDAGYFGSEADAFAANTAMTYGSDFALVIDQDDGTSRSGILVRINQIWEKPSRRQRGLLSPFVANAYGNIKVVYTAGYTPDTLPAPLRAACNILVAKLRNLLPLGSFLTSESYEERAVGYFIPQKRLLLAEVWPMLHSLRNYAF